MVRSVTNRVEEYHKKLQEERARLIQLFPEDLLTLKRLVEKYFPLIEPRLISSGFIPITRYLYLRTPDDMAYYYPNNVFRIEETNTLAQALEILCEVGCLTLPDPTCFKETHPHNTSYNFGIKPTISDSCLIVPNGVTIGVRGDATYWKFGTISNFTFFYQFNGSLWAKNIQETQTIEDEENFFHLGQKLWAETTKEEFQKQFLQGVTQLRTDFGQIREVINPQEAQFEWFRPEIHSLFFDGPSNGY